MYHILNCLILIVFCPFIYFRKGIRKQREVLRDLKDMFHASSIFDIESTTTVLMVNRKLIPMRCHSWQHYYVWDIMGLNMVDLNLMFK
jgi:hypothetical protein